MYTHKHTYKIQSNANIRRSGNRLAVQLIKKEKMKMIMVSNKTGSVTCKLN